MAKNNSLSKLKNKLETETYKSNFDFETFEIDLETKKFVIEKEKNLSRNFRKNSDLMFQICKDLYEVSIKLKENNTFMSWYESCGLNKDLVSCLMKRYRLYVEFQDNKDFISSLPDQAVKYLTNKNVTYDDRLPIIENKIKNSEEIKEALYSAIEDNKKDFPSKKNTFNFFDINKIEKLKKKIKTADTDALKELKKNLLSAEQEIKSLKQEISEQENNISNENNIPLFDK